MQSLLLWLHQRKLSVITVLVVFVLWGTAGMFYVDFALAPKSDPSRLEFSIDISRKSGNIEHLLFDPLRSKLENLPGVTDVIYRSRHNECDFYLSLAPDVRIHEQIFLVQDVITQFSRHFPELSFTLPEVSDFYNIPLMRIYLYSHGKGSVTDLHQLSVLAKNWIEPRIIQAGQTGEVKISGNVEKLKVIRPNLQRLKAFGITPEEIRETLELTHRDQLIEFVDGSISYISSSPEGQDISGLMLPSGYPVSVVCDISDSVIYKNGSYEVNGAEAVVMDIYSEPGASVIKATKELKAIINEIRSERQGIGFHISSSQDELIRSNISQLLFSLGIVCLVISVVVYFFTGNFRQTACIALTVPVSLIISFGILTALEIRVHIFVLSGVILGIGLLIDTPIVIADALQKSKTKRIVHVLRLVSGVSTPVIMSVFTTIMAFIPMLFISARTRQLFMDQFISLSIMLGVSLIIGLLVLPLFWKSIIGFKENVVIERIKAAYERSLDHILRKTIYIKIGLILMVMAAALSIKKMQFRLLPNISFNNWQIHSPGSFEPDLFPELLEATEAIQKHNGTETRYLRFNQPVDLSHYQMPPEVEVFPSPNPIINLFPAQYDAQDLRVYPHDKKQMEFMIRKRLTKQDTIWQVRPNELWSIAEPFDASFLVSAKDSYRLEYREPDGRISSRLGRIFLNRIADIFPVARLTETWKDRYGNFIPIKANTQQINGLERSGIPLRRVQTEDEFRLLNSNVRWSVLIIVFVTYLVLALQFSSWTWPIVVLISIPISISGSLLGLWISGIDINIISIVGIVITLGIAVNDAILKVSAVQTSVGNGFSMKTAIRIASRERFKPVVMTTITTLAACYPMFWMDEAGSQLQMAIGITMSGGLSSSTVGALYVIPVLLKSFGRST